MLPRRLLPPLPLLPPPAMVAIETKEDEGSPETEEEEEQEEDDEDNDEEGFPFFTGDWKESERTLKTTVRKGTLLFLKWIKLFEHSRALFSGNITKQRVDLLKPLGSPDLLHCLLIAPSSCHLLSSPETQKGPSHLPTMIFRGVKHVTRTKNEPSTPKRTNPNRLKYNYPEGE